MLKQNYEQPIEVRNFSEQTGAYQFDKVNPYDIDDDLDFKYIPGSSLPENRASRFDQALQLAQLGLLTPEQFWRWTQKDISKEILDEMMEQKRIQQEDLERDEEILNELKVKHENEIKELNKKLSNLEKQRKAAVTSIRAMTNTVKAHGCFWKTRNM